MPLMMNFKLHLHVLSSNKHDANILLLLYVCNYFLTIIDKHTIVDVFF